MYKNIVELIKYILRNNDRDEDSEPGTNRSLHVKIMEHENKVGGTVQVDAVAPWIKQFHINSLNMEVLKKIKINLTVRYGDLLHDNFLVYSGTYNNMFNMMEFVLAVEQNAFIDDCYYYLSFTVDVNRKLIRNLAVRLREYIKSIAPNYPNIQMSYTESGTLRNDNNINERCFKMISEGVGDIITYSTSPDFCKQIFELLNVETSDAAKAKVFELAKDTHQNNEE